MTPRPAITMVTCWVFVPAIAAAIFALPGGMALQNAVVHAIAGGQQGPATWAAASRTTTALRAE